MKKILYVITALGVGGAENLLVDVCSVLKDNNEITVVFLNDLRDYEKQLVDMGIDVIFLDLKNLGFLRCVSELKRILRERKIQIVHTHLPAADTVGRAAVLFIPEVEIISTIHNSDTWKKSYNPKYMLLKAFNFFTVNFFRKVRLIAVSESVKKYCEKYEHISKKKITVIYNFIDYSNSLKSDSDFTPIPRGDSFKLLTVARLEPDKGHIFLLRALEELKKKNINVFLTVLGEGSLRGALEKFATEHNLSDNVTFPGNKKNVYDYLKDTNLFVLPSLNEGQSIAVLEAFYCRTPVLTSDIPANSELLHGGEYGVLFESENESDLANKIFAIIKGEYDFDGADGITKRAYEFCSERSKQNHITELEEFYNLSKVI